MFTAILLLIIGLIVLILGAESLVRGASSISKKLGIPPIVIGLTIVAFGTSAPELIVNVLSALNGTTDLALGNIIGSNISNMLLILGVSALIIDLKVQSSTTWKEIPFAALSVLVLYFMANDKIFDGGQVSVITRIDGLVLLSFFVIFMYYTFELFRSNQQIFVSEEEITEYSIYISGLLTLIGFAMLFFGGQMLVDQAVVLARLAGLSEMVIGLTIVAIGTSLPELVTSVIATYRGQTDIAIGNVVGSNIFNIFWILGVTSTIKPIPVSDGASINILICLIITIVLFVFILTGKRNVLQRYQGALFIISFIIYTVYLFSSGS